MNPYNCKVAYRFNLESVLERTANLPRPADEITGQWLIVDHKNYETFKFNLYEWLFRFNWCGTTAYQEMLEIVAADQHQYRRSLCDWEPRASSTYPYNQRERVDARNQERLERMKRAMASK